MPFNSRFRAIAIFSLCAAMFGSALAADEHVVRVGHTLELTTLDPVRTSNDYELIAAINMYDALVVPGPNNTIAPWIAKSWTVSADNLSYTFELRNDITFHDGKLLDAEDVAFSMRRALAVGGLIATYLKAVDKDRVEAVGTNTVRFHLKEADPAFLNALQWFRVMNKPLIMKNIAAGPHGQFGDYGAQFLGKNDAGSGPFTITRRDTSDMVVLSRFEKYPFHAWKPASPKGLRLQVLPEVVTAVTKLKAGELDIIPSGSLPRRVVQELSEDPRFVVTQRPRFATYYITMNNARPPLDDANVRRAVAYAYDADTAANKILNGGAPLKGPVPPQILGKCDGIADYSYSLDKARESLRKSKYSAEDLQKLPLEIAAVATNENFKNISLMLSLSLKKIGLNVQVKPVRWSEIVQAQTKPENAFPFVLYFDSALLGHPSQLLYYYTKRGWGETYPGGGIYWSSPEVEALMTKAAASKPADQQPIYCDIVKRVAAESPSIFSHTDTLRIPYWKYLNGYRSEPGPSLLELRFDTYEFKLDDPAYTAQRR